MVKQLIFLCIVFILYSNVAEAEQRLILLKHDGDKSYFTGVVTVSGEFELRTDETTLEVLGEVLCFTPKGETAKLIPRGKGDSRMAWFCFVPQMEAWKLLKIPASPVAGTCGYSGNATIQISNYVVDHNESEVYDEARLVKVISATAPKSLKCD